MGSTPVKRALALAGALGGATVLGTACTASGQAMAPACSGPRFDPPLLVAQSVPTAERIPCILGYPAGWRLSRVEVRSGHTAFVLHSDRAGRNALKGTLERTCATSGAVEVATDEPGTVRHDRRVGDDGDSDDFREIRTYGFPGGCVTYEFKAGTSPALRDEASSAVGFVTRAAVDANARQMTDGRVHL